MESLSGIQRRVVLYDLAVPGVLIVNYLHEIIGIKNIMKEGESGVYVIIAVLILLTIPWILRFINNAHCKKIISDFGESFKIPED